MLLNELTRRIQKFVGSQEYNPKKIKPSMKYFAQINLLSLTQHFIQPYEVDTILFCKDAETLNDLLKVIELVSEEIRI